MFKLLCYSFALISFSCYPKHSDLERGWMYSTMGVSKKMVGFPISICIQDHEQEFVEAISWWNTQMSRDGKNRIIFVKSCVSSRPVLAYFSDDEPLNLGTNKYYINDSTGIVVRSAVVVDPGMEKSLEQKVIRHELGHVIGLCHDISGGEPPSVMEVPILDGYVLTQYDFALIKRRYHVFDLIF